MAGPMGGGGVQNAIMSQMLRKKQTQDTLNSPGAVGGIGQQQSPAGDLGAAAGMAGPEAGMLMGGLQKAGGFLSNQVTAPATALANIGRSVQGMGPRLANTIQGGSGPSIQGALMNAMNAGKPGIGSVESPAEEFKEPKMLKDEAGEMHAPEPFNPNEEAQRLDIIRAGQPRSVPPVSGPQPQGTTPSTPAPGQPFRSEDFAAPVGPPMNKQRRRPGII